MTDTPVTSGNDMSPTVFDDGSAAAAEGIADELTQEAGALELVSTDLDQTVYEALHQRASENVNNSGEDFWTVYDREHDHADHTASETNNSGLRAQLRLLAEHFGAPQVSGILRDLAAEIPRPTPPMNTGSSEEASPSP